MDQCLSKIWRSNLNGNKVEKNNVKAKGWRADEVVSQKFESSLEEPVELDFIIIESNRRRFELEVEYRAGSNRSRLDLHE